MIRLSLRARLVAIVAIGVLLPLVVVAAWSARSLRQAGESLLRAQLNASLDQLTNGVRTRWELQRGDLMLLGDNPVVRAALRNDTLTPLAAQHLAVAFSAVQHGATEVQVRDADGGRLWRIGPDPGGRPEVERIVSERLPASRSPDAVAVTFPISDSAGVLGTMTALVRLNALLPAIPITIPGASFDLYDTGRDIALRGGSESADGVVAAQSPVMLLAERSIAEPPLRFVAQAPLEPYVAPFERQTRRAGLVLLTVVSLALALAGLLTSRATRALRELAIGADEVARGNLDHQVAVETSDEIGRLAAAFNTMTQELQKSVRELSHRNALAAVGVFAAELAHEVRNPLTSIRLDLQRAHERASSDSRMREPLARALAAVDRLNRTVIGALRVARSGRVRLEPLQLRAALEPAIQAAEPAFAVRSANVNRRTESAIDAWVRGDVDALTQLFTNILLNAAEASGANGHVEIDAAQHNGSVVVSIADSGPGIPADLVPQSDTEFTTTKRDGTGLGLTIARRIATAHGGTIDFSNRPGGGAVVSITLPKVSDDRFA